MPKFKYIQQIKKAQIRKNVNEFDDKYVVHLLILGRRFASFWEVVIAIFLLSFLAAFDIFVISLACAAATWCFLLLELSFRQAHTRSVH